VLKDDQSRVSDTFAGRHKDIEDKFSCANWQTLSTGAPALQEALVNFDCTLGNAFQLGTHWIFFGEVTDINIAESASPLIYANRAYGKAIKLDDFTQQQKVASDGANVVNVGYYPTLGAYFMPRLIGGYARAGNNGRIALHEGEQSELEKGLIDGRYDLSLVWDSDMSDVIVKEPLAEMPPHVLLPSEHPLAKQASVSLHDLAPQPLVLLDIAPGNKFLTSFFDEVGLTPKIAYRSHSFELVRGMVGHGLGYSILATKPANNMTYDGVALVSLPIEEKVTPSRIILARHRDALNPVAEKFVAYCRSHFLT
jgi:DNA-binding transcriptional LysR family regulator